ncbi:histone-lysine N-methyltransferase, H3 lysine-36 specific-like isoform X2 [Amphibalanus amphitrite]|uniref:histone-lysine N-methyltransferase, H3 lysine-36 specific-like isoform X2 n=1 Tax=Amphibalanus amphitrite TaxID=1232801 RepID=UPI001C92020D|nr:histone-lysine N-methyltransferase, H3 lysine-36 specific-like isoform X2 [Amphibalanus amphitrite]XP_043212737.1 histone-lysine N-methyltransferase, H3 lysine-36 specific-like isoform X2 [Amphibalanus amphitrite]
METRRRCSMSGILLLTCLILGLFGTLSHGAVIESRHSSTNDVTDDVSGVHRHSIDSGSDVKAGEQSPSASHWRTLTTRLSAVLHMMRLKQRSPPAAPEPGRSRRSYEDSLALEQSIEDDIQTVEREHGSGTKAAQQRVIEGQIARAEQAAGVPTDADKMALEQAIERDIHEVEEMGTPEYKRRQKEAIERIAVEADAAAHRAVDQRKFEQHREIQREIAEFERKAGVPSDEAKLALETAIEQDIKAMEAHERERQAAIQKTISDDINAMRYPNWKPAPRPTTGTAASSSSEESKEAGDTSPKASSAEDDDDDWVYDDAFGADSSLVSPLDENGSDDDILSPNRVPLSPAKASPPETGGQGQVREAPVQAAHSTWQVTLMTVIMCSIVGLVLLLVVGAWYRDLRSFRPGKPQHLLLEEDEQGVYHSTTQPEPRQVGAYSPLT